MHANACPLSCSGLWYLVTAHVAVQNSPLQHKAELSLKVAKSGLVLLQLAAWVPLALSIYLSQQISFHLRERYKVYHDMAGATARMLMPAKIQTYSGHCADDARNISTVSNVDEVPLCGVTLNGGATQTSSSSLPYQLPLWALFNDESGLEGLANMLV
jgi:hypothetical protein